MTSVRNPVRDLVIGLAPMISGMLVVAIIVWVNIGRMEAADAGDREATDELIQATAVIGAMIDQETGFRGYALTGDPRYLKPYYAGRQRADAAFRRLKALTDDDPVALQRRVTHAEALAGNWVGSVAEPAIAALQAGVDRPGVDLVGKSEMDGIRADIGVLRVAEQQVLEQRQRAQQEAYVNSRLTLVIGSLAALGMAGVLVGHSLRQLAAERKVAEDDAEALRAALEGSRAATQAKTLFLSNMSHEMRTPLNGVVGMAEILAQTPLSAHQGELVGVIRESAAALADLIGDLLALSSGDRAEDPAEPPRAFALGDGLRALVESHRAAAEAKGLAMEVAVAPEAEVRVIGDTVRLKHLMNCLVSNAIKFTDEGHVRVDLRRLAADRYEVSVADTGVGFDEARKAKLFEAFSQSDDSATRRHGGAGLGLALARQLAAILGGRLDCHSAPGEGSVFSFEMNLPAAAGDIAEVAEPAGPDDALRVLIVDDNATNRKVLELILGPLGVDWVSVENGEEAVAAAAREDFSAILMDIQMPVMDGLTATREIRRAERATGRPATPIVIVSANGQPEHIQAGRDAGAQLHITKPVAPQTLVDALNVVLAGETELAA
jgi:signal transduction histidine kinase/ActR/RegA family two-component response regulator